MSILFPDETILGLLAARPRHGYELLDYFRADQTLGRLWTLSTSQLYAVLKRLEREGWISGHEVVTDNAPPRTEYTLTVAGEARLQAWLDQTPLSASIRRIRVDCLSRLFIAQQLKLPTTPIIDRQYQVCSQKVVALIAQRDQAMPGMDRVTLDFQTSQLEAALLWLDRCVMAFEEIPE